MRGGVRFSSGSYVGTGTSGEASPCSVDIGFEPKLFFVFRRTGVNQSREYDDLPWGCESTGFWVNGMPNGLYGFHTNSVKMIRPVTVNGTVISWYLKQISYGGLSAGEAQLNAAGITYRWFALG